MERHHAIRFEDGLKLFEGFQEGGLLTPLQVDQVKSTLLQARSAVLKDAQDMNNALDQRKVALQVVQAQIKAEEEAEAELTKEAEDLTARLEAAPEISHGSESASGGGLVLPVSGSIVSGFGPRGRGYHYGVDISGGTGTPIRAARDGTVAGVS